MLMLDRVKHSS